MTSSLNMIRGRSNIVTLTNNSGGALVAGDVCVQDTSADEKVTTTTSAASVLKVFVAAESIASGAAGRFYESGYCPLVNVNASVTRGRFLFTHTVAKQAAENATYGSGAFGKILKSGTTPSAIIYSATAQVGSGVARSGSTTDGHLAVWDGSNADSIKDGGAAGGAPTTALYVTTAADAGLSAEVVIPGLAGSPDIAGAGGGGISEEYDTATPGLTWDSTPTVVDSNTTLKSHLFVTHNANATITGLRTFSPAGAFDARAHISMGSGTAAIPNLPQVGLEVHNSDSSNRALVWAAIQASPYAQVAFSCYTYASSSYTLRGSAVTTYGNYFYVRLVRDGSNNISYYYSHDGKMWIGIVTFSFTMTVAKIGYRFSTVAANTAFVSDWLRTNV